MTEEKLIELEEKIKKKEWFKNSKIMLKPSKKPPRKTTILYYSNTEIKIFYKTGKYKAPNYYLVKGVDRHNNKYKKIAVGEKAILNKLKSIVHNLPKLD